MKKKMERRGKNGRDRYLDFVREGGRWSRNPEKNQTVTRELERKKTFSVRQKDMIYIIIFPRKGRIMRN
jgi:hypothetical protein